MILTGKAAEFAERFEEFEKLLPNDSRQELEELSEDEQIHIFQITMMFEIDRTFRLFIIACLMFYRDSILGDRSNIAKLIIKMLNMSGGKQ